MRDFRRLLIRCNKLSILSAHTTDELYATKKDIRTFNDQPLFETANKIQLYFNEASKIVIILVTAYQISIAAVVNRILLTREALLVEKQIFLFLLLCFDSSAQRQITNVLRTGHF